MSEDALMMIAQQNDLLCSIYACMLFTLGLGVAVFVSVLFYKFLRLFF